MVRQTSLMAYYDIKKSGELNKMQDLVYRCIRFNPDLTDKEASRITGLDINCHVPRRNELCKSYIEEKGKYFEVVCSGIRECTITGKKARVWSVIEV